MFIYWFLTFLSTRPSLIIATFKAHISYYSSPLSNSLIFLCNRIVCLSNLKEYLYFLASSINFSPTSLWWSTSTSSTPDTILVNSSVTVGIGALISQPWGVCTYDCISYLSRCLVTQGENTYKNDYSIDDFEGFCWLKRNTQSPGQWLYEISVSFYFCLEIVLLEVFTQ